MTVGDNQRSQGAEALESLVALTLGVVLANGSIRSAGVATRDELSLPDEVLEKVALVLGEKEDLGLLNNVLEISDQFSTFLGKLS